MEGRATGLIDINLLGRPRCESPRLRSRTAALNSAGCSCALGCSALAAAPFRGAFLSSVRRAGDGCAPGPDGLALPPLRHPLPWKFLSSLWPPDGRVGLPAASA